MADLAEQVKMLDQIYMETHDDNFGILLCCDICRDQGRDRIVKQLGWSVTFAHAIEMREQHLDQHPVIAEGNEPRD